MATHDDRHDPVETFLSRGREGSPVAGTKSRPISGTIERGKVRPQPPEPHPIRTIVILLLISAAIWLIRIVIQIIQFDGGGGGWQI